LLAAALTQAAALLSLPYALGRALDGLLTGTSGHEGPFRNWHNPFRDFNETYDVYNRLRDSLAEAATSLTWVHASLILLALAAASDAVLAWAGEASAAAGTARIRYVLLRHSLDVGPTLSRGLAPGDLVSRQTGSASQAGASTAHAVTAAAAGLPALGAIVLLFFIDVWCGLAFLVGLVVLAALLSTFIRTTTDVTEAYAVEQSRIAAALTEALEGARTVAAAGTREVEERRVLEPLPALRGHGTGLWRAQGAAIGQSNALLPLLEVVVLGVAGWQLTAGRISVGNVLAAALYVGLAVGAVMAVAELMGLAQAWGAGRRCAALTTLPATTYGQGVAAGGGAAVTFVEVRVGRGPHAALQGVTAHIPSGATVAVVGRSGAGKSTLAALVGRLIEPDAGVVCLDGEPVRELRPEALHRAVTYAFARPALIGSSIGDAIAFGPAPLPPEAVTAAARAACAHAFITRLPWGYDTPLRAAPLSGGEAQRLGLARAFAHADRVLVLDDATSSLDTVTELQVTRALLAGATGRTKIIIAHRASTAARADVVLWLDAGRVRGYGPHSDLWRDPEYRAVFSTTWAESPALPATNASRVASTSRGER
jgi:ATP-binding cassette subfamily B protein